MIPKDLTKPLDEIKTPGTKILLICLILAILAMGTVIGVLWRNNDSNLKAENKQLREENNLLKTENKNLVKGILAHQEEDNQRLRLREKSYDSLISISRNIKQTLDK